METSDEVLIGGFIVTGNVAKKVILGASGPSLTQTGVAGALADPVLELHAADWSFTLSAADQDALGAGQTVVGLGDSFYVNDGGAT